MLQSMTTFSNRNILLREYTQFMWRQITSLLGHTLLKTELLQIVSTIGYK